MSPFCDDIYHIHNAVFIEDNSTIWYSIRHIRQLRDDEGDDWWINEIGRNLQRRGQTVIECLNKTRAIPEKRTHDSWPLEQPVNRKQSGLNINI